MMKELKINLEPLEKARDLVKTERERIQLRHDKTSIEIEATESSLNLLSEEKTSQAELQKQLEAKIKSLKNQIIDIELSNSHVI